MHLTFIISLNSNTMTQSTNTCLPASNEVSYTQRKEQLNFYKAKTLSRIYSFVNQYKLRTYHVHVACQKNVKKKIALSSQISQSKGSRHFKIIINVKGYNTDILQSYVDQESEAIFLLGMGKPRKAFTQAVILKNECGLPSQETGVRRHRTFQPEGNP